MSKQPSSPGHLSSNQAPGRPGNDPTWSPAAKSGMGCALSPASRLWFTLGRGIVNEVYHPWIDYAAVRNLGFVVVGPDGAMSAEENDCTTDTQLAAPGVPAYRVENQCVRGLYRILKEIVVDPSGDVLLQRVRIVPLRGTLADLKLFALISPRLGDQGKDNSGWVGQYRGRQALFAQHRGHALALMSSAPWRHRSVGYVGQSDGWRDLEQHGKLTWEYGAAEHGHIALAGEVDLQSCQGQFVLALAIDRSTSGAALNGALSLNRSFDAIWKDYVAGWEAWQKTLRPLDLARDELPALDHPHERNRPDSSRPRVPNGPAGPPVNIYRSSMMVLGVHRAKHFNGAGVASLAIPWGDVRGDDDLGGYHLVWTRDLVEQAFGLLAAGAFTEVRSALDYLHATQKSDGSWPQMMWLDGDPYSKGIQLDETALPILAVDLAAREGALSSDDLHDFWPMVRLAAAFVLRSGPATGQDRWENTAGLSPYSLATAIAALRVAARLAKQFGEAELGTYLRETGELWSDLLESWTYVSGTPLAKRVGVKGYYVCIAPSPGLSSILARGEHPLMSQARDLPMTEVVSPDALALVRFGVRDAHDPRILDTLKVIDAVNRVETPAGPGFHRYNGGYYGEGDDGSPFHDGSRTGHGRLWPLLSGERGHYELAAGNTAAASQMLKAMSGFASQLGMIPEQVWDAEDLPEHHLYRGRPSGSAMPLVWANSEYARLVRSLSDGKVFDMPSVESASQPPAFKLALWRFEHQASSFEAGRRLRLEVRAPAVARFSLDGWKTSLELNTRDTGLGIHLVDLPTETTTAGARLSFTFRWPQADQRWEGTDFHLSVTAASSRPPAARSSPRKPSRPAARG